jgi:gas vesicle protein
MIDDTRSSGLQYLIAFAAGAAAGCAVAYLTAPRTGKATREALQVWAKDMRDKASRLPHATREALERGGRAGKDAFVESYRNGPTGRYA